MQRRSLDEIRARYELEPGLRDIYVEGSLDADIIRWALDRGGTKDVVVYEIDTVEVPAEVLERRGLGQGMRGRVVAFAEDLATYLPADARQATCIADLDLDLLVGNHVDSEHLIYTDFSCLEMYMFNVEVLNKFLRIIGSGTPMRRRSLLGSLQEFCAKLHMCGRRSISCNGIFLAYRLSDSAPR